MAEHQLKTWPEYFREVWSGAKTFEFRRNDRDFQIGDKLVLDEWDPIEKAYSGRRAVTTVTYILDDQMSGLLPAGFAILAMSPPVKLHRGTEIEIQPEDLRVDVFTSGMSEIGTYQCIVRIVHVPTGLVATSDQCKSQLAGKEQALTLLQEMLTKSRMGTARD